jgi:hypothetical protein
MTETFFPGTDAVTNAKRKRCGPAKVVHLHRRTFALILVGIKSAIPRRNAMTETREVEMDVLQFAKLRLVSAAKATLS